VTARMTAKSTAKSRDEFIQLVQTHLNQCHQYTTAYLLEGYGPSTIVCGCGWSFRIDPSVEDRIITYGNLRVWLDMSKELASRYRTKVHLTAWDHLLQEEISHGDSDRSC
jgi:hypothetical protein